MKAHSRSVVESNIHQLARSRLIELFFVIVYYTDGFRISLNKKRSNTINGLVKFVNVVFFVLKSMLLAAFPPGCHQSGGPYSMECLKGLWLGAGCVESGHGNPRNWTVSMLAHINSFPSIRFVQLA